MTSHPTPFQPLSSGLRDLLAVVTGSGRGIGAATAELLALRGAKVVLCARTQSELDRTVETIEGKTGKARVAAIALDLSGPDSASRLLDFAENRFGQTAQVLVNNAALGYTVPFLESESRVMAEEWTKIESVNIRAPFLLSHEFMRRLARAGKPGSIVNLSSLGGIRGTDKFPGLAAYVMSKFAIVGMTEALAVEGKSIGVRVNAIAPGAVETEMLKKAAPHLKTETKPEDIAKTIAYLCDPSESKALTGSVLEIFSNL